MITFLVTERFSSTIRKMLFENRKELRGRVSWISYEELFFERSGPASHVVFTDIDRLTRYELETASVFAEALRTAAPEAKILNDPALARDRLPLLAALKRAGVNDFDAIRLDGGARPARYPVFLRAEDSHFGPETDLLWNEEEFEKALADLARRKMPLRGRLAIGYSAEPFPDGRFRRYGALNIGGQIVADEVFISRGWVAKAGTAEWSPADVAEELEYARTCPHQSALLRAFEVGRLDYGRADYGIVAGRIQVYEINPSPAFPNYELEDLRSERRRLVRPRLIEALLAVDTPIAATGSVRFQERRPRSHSFRLPRQRLPVSLARRLVNAVRRPGRAP